MKKSFDKFHYSFTDKKYDFKYNPDKDYFPSTNEEHEAKLIARSAYEYCLKNEDYNFDERPSEFLNFNKKFLSEIRFFESKIFNSQDPYTSYKFARDIKHADVDKHLEFISSFKNVSHFVYYFALNVKGANINKCQEYLLKDAKESKTTYDLIEFARNIKGCDLKLIEDYILSLKVPYASIDFCTIEGSNFKEHEKVILGSKDLMYCFSFLIYYHSFIDKQPFIDALKGSKYEHVAKNLEKYDYHNQDLSHLPKNGYNEIYIRSMERIKETILRHTK